MTTKSKEKSIPDEWKETKLASIGIFSKGSGITKEQLSDNGHNAVRYGELYTRHHFHIRKIYSHISDNVARFSKKIKYGDILFAGSGETIDEIGKSAAYLLKEDGYAGGDVIIFSPKNANSLFLSYFLNIGEARKKLRELGQGQSVVHIYKGDIENLKLHLPPLPEQNRIVAVLETWDKVIEKLTKKIEIKKQIKKWLIQELLTGKIRLPGFKEKWREIAVDKVFSFLKTYAISRENLINGTSNENGIGNIHYGDIHSTYRTSNIDLKDVSVPLMRDKSFSPKAEDILMDGDLIMADVSEDYEGIGVTVSVHGLENKKVVGGLHTFALRDANKKTVERYRQYVFRNPNIRNKLKKIANGVSVYGISKTNLSKLLLILPLLPEQSHIVAVLESQDKAIEKLAKKLSLLQDQKKYLLNNLITGAIRTPETLKTKA